MVSREDFEDNTFNTARLNSRNAAMKNNYGGMAKPKYGGAGGNASKSNNHKEVRVADKRRFAKQQWEEREELRKQKIVEAQLRAEEDERWKPVDAADAKHARKKHEKNN